ncbi:MAG: hypothetical protein SH818_13220 [Saprospiraceae bacterium]|nr:hypothetical protein [Saprospiraceae bacterium]
MTDTINLICWTCKHLDDINGGCKAFPDGIPDEVLVSNEHSKRLPDQLNDIVFEEDPELKRMQQEYLKNPLKSLV